MKKTPARLFIPVALTLFLLTMTACSKEPVSPYVQTDSTTGVPEAKGIEYTAPAYSDEMSPSVESLESPSEETQQDGQYNAGTDQAGMGDQESEEYKKTHGRSSEQLLPIYFDFDQASIRSDQFASLDQNSAFLKNNPSARIIVQGNCDDRGTNEYNLALGERRALNAKTYLIELGIEESRIRTVSYGEERPLFTGSDEFSWSQNRRDDFILE